MTPRRSALPLVAAVGIAVALLVAPPSPAASGQTPRPTGTFAPATTPTEPATSAPPSITPTPFRTPSPTATPTLPAWTPRGTWRAVHAPRVAPLWTRDGPRLNAVHAVTDGEGGVLAWAVGEACAVAVYALGRWQVDASAAAMCDGPREYELRDVFARGPDDLWAVGAYEGGEGLERVRCVAATPASRRDVDYDEGCGMVWRRTAGAWRAFHFQDFGMNVPVPALNGMDMMRVPTDGSWVGWAAGNNNDGDAIASIILEFVAGDERMAADGAWRRTGRAITPIDEDFHDVAIVAPGEAWIVGEGGNESLFRAPPAGSGIWAAQGISGIDHLYAADLSDATYGWSGGQRGRMNHYDGNCHDDDPATACWFDNRGRPVRHPASPNTGLGNEIRALQLLSRGVGWIAGRSSGSASFVAFLQPDHQWWLGPVDTDPGHDLFGLHFVEAHLGWAVGAEGTILEYAATADTPVPTPSATSTPTVLIPATATTGPRTPTQTPTPVATRTTASPPTDMPTPDPTAAGPGEPHRFEIALPFCWFRRG